MWIFTRENLLAWLMTALAVFQGNPAGDAEPEAADVAVQTATQDSKPDAANQAKPPAAQTQAADANQAAAAANAGQLKPEWRRGQRWIVETLAQQTQSRDDANVEQSRSPVRWEFRVVGIERIGDRECYRVDVRCLTQGRAQPLASLWADRESLALRQVQTQLAVQGKVRTVTEQYSATGQQATPVFGPLTALPIDLPLFVGQQQKALGEFSYQAQNVVPGGKAVDQTPFAFDIRQEVKPADAAKTKELLSEKYVKDLDKQPVMEVKLSGAGREVRQLWRPNMPWPLFSENGSAEARLIEVVAAPADSQ